MTAAVPTAAGRAAPATALAQLLAALGGSPDDPRFAIDPRDEMLHFLVGVHDGDVEQARCDYFRTGHAIAATLEQVLRWRFDDGASPVVLDFASGYGRVTRFLLDAVPPDRLWVSDVLAEAVAAQRAAFGVQGFVSTLQPEGLAPPRAFDAVAVTSLFTHLPEERFHSWLAALWQLVGPGGVLLFTTHDAALHPDEELRDERFAFESTSESSSLSAADYGTTWVSEAFVRTAIARACGGAAARRLPRAVCNFQDLWVVAPEPSETFASLELHAEPDLVVEKCTLDRGELELEGWAIARHGRAERVVVTLGGVPAGEAAVGLERGDLADRFDESHRHTGWRWRGRLPAATVPGDVVVSLAVADRRGVEHPAWTGPLLLLQMQVHRLRSRSFEAQLSAKLREQSFERARAQVEIDALRARVAAMEASRFWKLRNAWFAVKRALRLTDQP